MSVSKLYKNISFVKERRMRCGVKKHEGIDNCDGEIDFAKGMKLSVFGVGEACKDPVYPCKKCKRLHWIWGRPVINRQGQKVFMNDEEVVRRLY